MATLTQTELGDNFLDRLGANVTTDAPISTAEKQRYLNDAYQSVWELSGGRIKVVASATAWTSAQTATGVVTGILTDVETLTHVWASTTSGSVGVSTGDVEVHPVDHAEIQFLRSAAGMATYLVPKVYSLTRLATVTPASVNLLRLDYWPSVTGFYLPIEYNPQFTPLDGSSVTTPDLNDVESRDLYLLAAATAAPILGRSELVPGILADISPRTQGLLARKLTALMDALQDA